MHLCAPVGVLKKLFSTLFFNSFRYLQERRAIRTEVLLHTFIGPPTCVKTKPLLYSIINGVKWFSF